MLTFLEFIKLQEGLSIKDGEASINYKSSESDIHSLKMGKDKRKTPYMMNSKLSNFHPVFSSYSFDKGEMNTNILKALKGKESIYSFTEDEINSFVKRTAFHLWSTTIKDLNIDVVVSIKSKSDLGKKFSFEFQKRINSVVYLPDSIMKSHINNVKIKENVSKAQEVFIQRIIDRNKEKGKSFDMKEVPGRERQFISNFLEWNNIYNKIQDKNVLIVDDYLTTGSTMSEAFRVIDEMKPKNLYGVTLIK